MDPSDNVNRWGLSFPNLSGTLFYNASTQIPQNLIPEDVIRLKELFDGVDMNEIPPGYDYQETDIGRGISEAGGDFIKCIIESFEEADSKSRCASSEGLKKVILTSKMKNFASKNKVDTSHPKHSTLENAITPSKKAPVSSLNTLRKSEKKNPKNAEKRKLLESVKRKHKKKKVEETEIEELSTVIEYLASFLEKARNSEIPLEMPSRQDISWKNLRWYFESLHSKKCISKLPTENMIELESILVNLLDENSCFKLFDSSSLPDTQEIESIAKLLEGCLLIGIILSSENMSRRLITDDLILSLFGTLKRVVEDLILQILEPSFRVDCSEQKSEDKKTKTQTKKKEPTNKNNKNKYWGQISEMFGFLIVGIPRVLDHCRTLIKNEILSDNVVMPLLSLSITSLSGYECFNFQKVTIFPLIISIFQRFTTLRYQIFEDIIHLFSGSLECPGRFLKRFTVDSKLNQNGTSTTIQLLSALVFQLIQSLSIEENAEEEQMMKSLRAFEEDVLTSKECGKLLKHITAKNEHSNKISKEFVALFLSVFLRKTQESTSFRNVISNFVKDVLNVIFLPDYPIAETILYFITLQFCSIIGRKDHSNEWKPPVRLLAVELLGIICKELQFHLSSLVPLEVLPRRETHLNKGPGDEGEDNSCICKQAFDKKMKMIDCVECRKWFHISCIFRNEGDNPPESWICNPCQIRKAILSHKKIIMKRCRRSSLNLSEEIKSISTENVLKQLVVNYITEKCSGRDDLFFARQFFLYQTVSDVNVDVSEDNDSDALMFFIQEWKPRILNEEYTLDMEASNEAPTLSLNGIISCLRQLGSRRQLLSQFPKYFSLILKTLSEEKPKVRAKVMKAVASIIESEPDILTNVEVRNAIEMRCRDVSISVREATFELLGRYVSVCPKSIKDYYPILAQRINDQGVSVRKRVLSIFKDLIISGQAVRLPYYVEICVILVSKYEDESSVRNIVSSTFEQAWLSSSVVKKRHIKNSAANVLDKSFSNDFKLLSFHLVDIINKLKKTEVFVMVLKTILSSQGKNSLQESYFNVCSDIAKVIVHHLITGDGSEGRSVSSSFKLLVAFCKVDPKLLLPHAHALQPFLKTSTSEKDSIEILKSVNEILSVIIPMMSNPSSSFLQHVESDLLTLIANHGNVSVLKISILTLTIIVEKVTSHFAILDQLLEKYSSNLSSVLQNEKTANPGHICRWIACLGLLLFHFDFDKHCERNNKVPEPPFKMKIPKASHESIKAICNSCFFLISKFTKSKSDMIKRYALQSIIYLFSRAPALLVPGYKMIKDELDKADSKMHLILVSGLKNFLLSEDGLVIHLQKKDAESKQTSEELSYTSNNENGCLHRDDNHVGDGFVNGMMRAFLPSLLNLLLSMHPNLRFETLSTIGLLLRFGLVNPQDCISHIFGASLDNEVQIRSVALQLVQAVVSKHKSFLTARLSRSVICSYKHLKAIKCVDLRMKTQNLDGIKSIFNMLNETRDGALNFIKSILPLLDVVKYKDSDSFSFFAFVCKLIAELPFKYDEPLHIIHYLEKAVVKFSENIRSKLEAHFESESKLESKQLNDMCLKAMDISIMCFLKEYLKKTFDLSPEKCNSFDPHVSAKHAIKPVRQFEASFNIDKIPISNVTHETQYYFFKELLQNQEYDIGISFSKTPKKAKKSQKKVTPKRKTPSKKRKVKKQKSTLSEESDDGDEDYIE